MKTLFIRNIQFLLILSKKTAASNLAISLQPNLYIYVSRAFDVRVYLFDPLSTCCPITQSRNAHMQSFHSVQLCLLSLLHNAKYINSINILQWPYNTSSPTLLLCAGACFPRMASSCLLRPCHFLQFSCHYSALISCHCICHTAQ